MCSVDRQDGVPPGHIHHIPLPRLLAKRRDSQPRSYISSKLADGLLHPTYISNLSHLFTPAYAPTLTPEAALYDLPSHMYPVHHLDGLMERFTTHMEERAAIAARPASRASEPQGPIIDRSDHLALFIYSYEIKEVGSAARRFADKQGATFLELLEAYAQKLYHISEHRLPAPPGVLERVASSPVTGNAFLHGPAAIDRQWCFDDTEAEYLDQLRSFIRSIRADTSYERQLYRDMNTLMRDNAGTPLDILPLPHTFQPLIYLVQKALEALPAIPSTVYRGIALRVDPQHYPPGACISWPAFSSTSAAVQVAKDFINQSNSTGVLFILHLTTTRSIMEFSAFAHEQELLLPPHTCLRVVGRASAGVKQLLQVKDGVDIIELKELVGDEREAERLLEIAHIRQDAHEEAVARACLEEAYQLYPHTAPGQYAKSRLVIKYGCCHLLRAPFRAEHSLSFVHAALRIDPDHLPSRYSQAMYFYTQADRTNCEIMLSRILQINPLHTRALDLMGQVLIQSSRTAEARAYFDQLADMNLFPLAPTWPGYVRLSRARGYGVRAARLATLAPVIILLVGLGLGFLVGWLVFR
eukprot:NODE_92_length_1984_cov_341.535917_g69_i0.p1 GENE.NODE_92_length_1984_cov_341.535917_g69_i0~~NODE_92_length_1984_cov_341.535917_g69_i0.p1  ORF type:complete len:619 (-),score=202.34 NODE_92_length_1984_cov_341.535917_g69_i0:128-1876(-)